MITFKLQICIFFSNVGGKDGPDNLSVMFSMYNMALSDGKDIF